jgi:multidrug resistance efflux pump
MQLATRNLARLRELYKNLAISQRELDQAASDQQTAKAICGRRCQQEARLPRPPS